MAAAICAAQVGVDIATSEDKVGHSKIGYTHLAHVRLFNW
jgi:hypothetical protein